MLKVSCVLGFESLSHLLVNVSVPLFDLVYDLVDEVVVCALFTSDSKIRVSQKNLLLAVGGLIFVGH